MAILIYNFMDKMVIVIKDLSFGHYLHFSQFETLDFKSGQLLLLSRHLGINWDYLFLNHLVTHQSLSV